VYSTLKADGVLSLRATGGPPCTHAARSLHPLNHPNWIGQYALKTSIADRYDMACFRKNSQPNSWETTNTLTIRLVREIRVN